MTCQFIKIWSNWASDYAWKTQCSSVTVFFSRFCYVGVITFWPWQSSPCSLIIIYVCFNVSFLAEREQAVRLGTNWSVNRSFLNREVFQTRFEYQTTSRWAIESEWEFPRNWLSHLAATKMSSCTRNIRKYWVEMYELRKLRKKHFALVAL